MNGVMSESREDTVLDRGLRLDDQGARTEERRWKIEDRGLTIEDSGRKRLFAGFPTGSGRAEDREFRIRPTPPYVV